MDNLFERPLLRSGLLSLILAIVTTTATAQDPDKPLALLRQSAGTENYVIRVQTNAHLPAESKLSAILTNKSNLITWAEEVKDCPVDQVNQFCKETEQGFVVINYPLTAKPQTSDRLKVSFAISDKSGRGSFRSIDLITDFKPGGPRLDNVCGNGLIVEFQTDNAALSESEAEYYRARLLTLNKWFRTNKSDPARMATVHLEPLTDTKPPDPTIKDFSVSPALDPDRNPHELDIEAALGSQRVLVCLQLEESLPTGKFNAQVIFQNNPPFEFDRSLTRALSGPKAVAVPVASKVADENKLGLRAFDNNLEIGMLFTSSVKDVKANNKTTRQRQSRGSLDVRFAPLLRDRTNPPEVKKWQPFWTPLFLDAKVSTGKIAEDTLSLNRILIGTEVNFRRVQGTSKGQRDKYVISLRGTNASDRDFKLAEAKGEFEFRPIFEWLNQPLRIRHTSARSVLVPDGPPVEIASGFFGYQIQPFFGVEAGRVYRRSRSAFKAEEQGDSVRRLLFGADLSFNFSSRLTMTMTDIFYIRGETPTHRNRNYFLGTIEAPLGNLNRNAAQSVFFSFERGNQPPFVSPAVNAVKFGYRVRSDFFTTGSAR
jgi:hypothetical protein